MYVTRIVTAVTVSVIALIVAVSIIEQFVEAIAVPAVAIIGAVCVLRVVWRYTNRY